MLHQGVSGVNYSQRNNPRFDRAASTPICYGSVFGLLGYNTDTKAETQILEGSFVQLSECNPAIVIIPKNCYNLEDNWGRQGECHNDKG